MFYVTETNAQQPAQEHPAVSEFKPYGKDVSVAGVPIKNKFGQQYRLGEHKGSWVLVNLWATWCPPCVQELPTIEELDFLTSDEDFKVLAISVDRYRNGTQLQDFLNDIGVFELEFAYDSSNQLLTFLQYRGLPTTYIISPDSKVHGIYEGVANWSDPQTIEAIKAVLY